MCEGGSVDPDSPRTESEEEMKKLGLIAIALLIGASAWAVQSAVIKNTAGTEVFSVNYTDGSCTVEVNGVVSASDVVDAGTAPIATVTAAETPGILHKTTLTLASVPLEITADAITNAWGSVKVYDFPAGRILVHGVIVDSMAITVQTGKLPYASGGDFAIGTAATTSNDLTGTTFVDLCPKTSIDTLTNKPNAALAASAQFDGTATAKDVYVNFGIDQDDFLVGSTTATNTIDSVITIHWTNLGDY